jgi:lysophospholipase L1-like esterase
VRASELAGRTVTGAAATGLAALAVLAAEGLQARRREYLAPGSSPDADGVYGSSGDPLLRLSLLGESTAAGVGATDLTGTVGHRLAQLLVAEGRRVELHTVAVSGSRVRDLGPQVSRALLGRPDLAVVLVGANDALHLTPLARLEADLGTQLSRLRDAGVAVVVGTCPDLTGPTALARPLRDLLGWEGRRIAAASARAAAACGAAPVDLGELAGARMRGRPEMLSWDGYHPSSAGYWIWAEVLLEAVRQVAAVRLPS